MKTPSDYGRAERTETEAHPRGGRPTKAAAALRDERLLAIAAEMFMQHGFDATSMERLAETAMIGKATLYARYADKSQLFADVLRRRILLIYGPLEEEFAKGLGGKSLEETLLILARGFIDLAVAPSSIALGRILAAQGERFPELGKLAIEEGLHRQIRLMETILARFSAAHRYAIDDMALAADLFLSIVLGRISLMALLGVQMDPETLDRRVREAVRIFVRGLLVDAR
jgi:TetR/AcrR family transcriptional repressor of mexJK operon